MKKRTEAQKRADAKYNKLNRVNFQVKMTRVELKAIEETLTAAGMTKGQFLRWAVAELRDRYKNRNIK